MNSVLEQDSMVDTFAHFHPLAQARLTCWNQYKNHRYSNLGSRIDYILVDVAMLPRVIRGPNLPGGSGPGTRQYFF
jgi:exonuclease III